MRTLVSIALTLAAASVFVACQKESQATPAAPTAAAAQAGGTTAAAAPPSAAAVVAPAAVAAAAPPAADPGAPAPAADPMAAAGEKQYRVEAAEARLKSGATGTFKLVIKAANGLHFNAEYPAKFAVTPTAFVKSTKDKLSSKGGEVKVEGNDGVVSVPLQGLAAGSGNVEIVGSFSVCSAEQCYMLRDEKLSLKVVVE